MKTEKLSRNRKILRQHKRGLSYREIATIHGLHPSRVLEIVQQLSTIDTGIAKKKRRG